MTQIGGHVSDRLVSRGRKDRLLVLLRIFVIAAVVARMLVLAYLDVIVLGRAGGAGPRGSWRSSWLAVATAIDAKSP